MFEKGNKLRAGAKNPNAGRKSKAEEYGLQSLLDEGWPTEDRKQTIRVLSARSRSGDHEATKILLAYAYGKPVERKELTGAGGADLKIIVEYVDENTTTERGSDE